MWIPPGLTSGPRTQEFKQEQNEHGPGYWQYAQGPLHHSKLRGSNRVVGEKVPANWLTGCHSLEICAQNENGEFIILNLKLFHSSEHTKKDVVSSEVRSHRATPSAQQCTRRPWKLTIFIGQPVHLVPWFARRGPPTKPQQSKPKRQRTEAEERKSN